MIHVSITPANVRGAGAVRRLSSIAVALSLFLVLPGTAFAHASLKSAAPAAGAQLVTIPRELRLVFSEAPALVFSTLELIDPAGGRVALGALGTAADSRRALVAAIIGQMGAGTYTVVWQIAGDDGHPIRGRYTFTIASGAVVAPSGAPLGTASAGTGVAGVPAAAAADGMSRPADMTFEAESPAYVVIRAVLFIGLLATIGVIAFQGVVLALLRTTGVDHAMLIAAATTQAARVGIAGALLVLAAAVARLLAQSYAMHGPQQIFNTQFIRLMLTSTVWGWGWLMQSAAACVAVGGFWWATRRPAPGWWVARIGVGILAFTPALSGHAAAAPELTTLAIAADGLHVIGAGGWLGSLLLVILVGVPLAVRLSDGERGKTAADLFNAFSPAALTFGAIAGVTGVFAGWLHLGSVPALWQSAYGQTLLVKLALLSILALIGANNWLRIKPTLGTDQSVPRMRRSAVAEIAVGGIIVVVTAVLVATSPPETSHDTVDSMPGMAMPK